MNQTAPADLGTRYAAASSSQNPVSLASFYNERGSSEPVHRRILQTSSEPESSTTFVSKRLRSSNPDGCLDIEPQPLNRARKSATAYHHCVVLTGPRNT